MVKPLYKTTVEIWSSQDPREMELSDLAREAEIGDALVGKMGFELIEHPESDPDFPESDMFGAEDYDFRLSIPMSRDEAVSSLREGNHPIRVEKDSYWAEAHRVPNMGYEVMTDDGQLTPLGDFYMDADEKRWENQYGTPEAAMDAMTDYLDNCDDKSW